MAVELKGALKLRKALREFEPDLAKQTTKQMTAVLKPMTNKARGFMPADSQMLSGWTGAASSADTAKYRMFPKYDQTLAKRGVKFSTSPSKPNRSGFVSLARIINTSAGGAIYETAGRKNPGGQPSQASTRGKYSNYIDTSNKVNKSLNPNAGKQFIDRANSLGQLVNARPRQQGQVGRSTRKMTGRVIFRAFSEDQGKAVGAVAKAIQNSANEFKARTDGK
jgi:hypothetical protein